MEENKNNYVIYKFPITYASYQIIETPPIIKWLKVDIQNGHICIWAIVRSNYGNITKRAVRIIATGESFNSDDIYNKKLCYVGTVQQNLFVWHIFVDESPNN